MAFSMNGPRIFEFGFGQQPFQPQSLPSRGTENLPPTRIVRVAQAFVYVVSTIQLTIALIAPCVFFATLKSNSAPAEFSSLSISVLMSNAFLGVCGGLGLAAASGRSRVVMAILLPASLLVFAMSCILINAFVSMCHQLYSYDSSRILCDPSGRDGYYYDSSSSSQLFSKSNYTAMLANEGLILTFTILSVMATAFLFFTSCIKRNSATN